MGGPDADRLAKPLVYQRSSGQSWTLIYSSYTAILGREGDQVKILEETVTMDAPDK
jgi:hypothetical protein